MLSRSGRLIPLVRKSLSLNTPAVSSCSKLLVRFDHHGPPADYKFPTMDELPVPCGSWQENYDNNQRKYNIHLLLGIGVFTITLAVGYYANAFSFYMFPPEKPSPPLP
ncbi:hypothetical protein RUM43_010382 [Polyplax serrata]|uniref:Deltamethrin resistance protein prag01 domain-containing protein n=1 Tax=Polyplax serrata TaxID=468196 RepID=A0AAN8P7B1_POLSC